ncbi:MAG: type II toxin-antitoxin system HicB family antitoxin [Armatimonadetes bacterium]|nr:type II toxin-antitoxin system HicB family antitoxin [Armatimonadota bacterium]
MEKFILPIEVAELPGGRYVATCPLIEGCHAEGRTAKEAIDNMEDIARGLIETKSPFAVLAHPHASPPKARNRCPMP